MSWILYALSGILSGLIGSMGIGGGGILIIYLTLFASVEQTKAQGINLLFFIPTALLAIIIYSKKKLIDWRLAFPLSLLGIGGAVLGVWISSIIDNSWLSKIFGFMLIFLGLKELFGSMLNGKKSRV